MRTGEPFVASSKFNHHHCCPQTQVVYDWGLPPRMVVGETRPSGIGKKGYGPGAPSCALISTFCLHRTLRPRGIETPGRWSFVRASACAILGGISFCGGAPFVFRCYFPFVLCCVSASCLLALNSGRRRP